MASSSLRLRELVPEDEAAFARAVAEFAKSDPDWSFAFNYDPASDFRAFIDELGRQRDGRDLPEGRVPSTFLVAVVDDVIAGRVSLRHELNEFLNSIGGHVGYGVVASQRRKGYATAMLRETLPMARAVGIERLLVTCDETNEGSIRTIERNGGVLADSRPQPGTTVRKLRYWIDLRSLGR
jgi:predicted acetyltransferase